MTEAEKLLKQAKEKGKVIANTEEKKQEAAKPASFLGKLKTVAASGTSPRVETVKDTGLRKQIEEKWTERKTAKANSPKINVSDSFLINDENPFTRARAKAQDLTRSTATDEKTRLYETNDRFLSDAEILKKYDYAAKDAELDYGTLKKAVKKGLSEAGRIRDRNLNLNYGTLKESIEESLSVLYGNRDKELLSSVRGDAEKAGMVNSAAKLQSDLKQRLRSTAFGAGFGQAAGLDIYDAAAKNLAEKANFAPTAAQFEKNESLRKSLEERYPKSYTAGKVSGELTQQGILYGTVGKAAEAGLLKGAELMGLTGTKARAMTALLAQTGADTVVNTPITALRGAAEGKNREEIAADVRKQIAMDAAFNAGIAGVGALGKLAGKALKKASQKGPILGMDFEKFGYDNAEVDEGILKHMEYLKNNPSDKKIDYSLKPVSERMAKDVSEQVGFDVSGYGNNLKPNGFDHIEKRHGTDGKHDQSMSDLEDIAKVQYILNHYDDVRLDKTKARGFTDSNGKLSKKVVFTKRINGTYYVVEAVPNTKRKRMEIIGVFKQKPDSTKKGAKKENALPGDVASPSVTSDNATATFSESSIAETTGKVNETGQKTLPKAGEMQKAEGAAIPEVQADAAAGALSADEKAKREIAQAMADVRDRNIKKMSRKELKAIQKEYDDLQSEAYIRTQTEKAIAESGGSVKSVAAEIRRLEARRKELAAILTQQEALRTEKDMVDDAADVILSMFGLQTDTQRHGISEKLKGTLRNAMKNGEMDDTEREKIFQMLYHRGSYRMEPVEKIKNELKSREILIDTDTAADIADITTWNRDLKGKLGHIQFRKEGNVESIYAKLHKKYPEYFPASVNGSAGKLQQMRKIAEMLEKGGKLTEEDFRREFDRSIGNLFDELGIKQVYRETVKDGYNPNRAVDFGNVSVDEVQEWHNEVYRLEQQLKQKGVPEEEFSTRERGILERMLAGDVSEYDAAEQLGDRFAIVKKQYDLQRPLRELQERIVGHKNYVHRMRHKEAERAVGKEIHIKEGNEEGWSDKWLPAFYARETQERNLRDIAPNKKIAEQINETYFAPVHENERQRVLMVEDYRDRVRAVGISTKENLKIPIEEIGKKKCSESTLVQYLGERRFDLKQMKEKSLTEEDYKAIGARLQQKGVSSWERQKLEARLKGEEDWHVLEEQLQAIEAQLTQEQLARINKGIVTLQEIYKELHPTINHVLITNGMDPIGYIDGYFPHMFFDDPTDEVGKAFKALGFDLTSRELPMDIAGRTETFRPGKRWSGNLLKRTGTETDYDAIRGFDQYIESVSDVIWHTDDIQRLRALEEHFRYNLSDEGVKERVKAIRADESLSAERKQTLIEKEYAENAKDHKLQNYVNNLRLYTDLLAGKKHDADRNMEKNFLGRGVYKAMNTLSNQISSNMVGANIGSALTNVIPMWQSMINMSVDSNLRGLKEGLLQLYPVWADDLTKKSTFLATRKGSSALYRTFWQKAGDDAFWLMEKADTFSTQTVWRSRYYDNLRNGLKEDAAIREADDYCRGLFGGRSKGAMPTIFSAKHPLIKTLTMFQLEVNNQISHVLKDIPDNAKGSTRKMLQAWAGIVIGGYMYNELYEKMTGRRAALDPIGIANEAIGDFSGERVRNLLDIAVDAADGGNVRFTERTEEKTGAEIYDGLKEDIANNIPFFGGLMGGGRIPLSSALPDFDAIARAKADVTSGDMTEEKKDQIVRKEWKKAAAAMVLPAGGNQLKKTQEGLWAMHRGGSYTQTNKGEKLQFAVDQENPMKWVQAGFFGKWAIPEAKEYLEKSNALGEKQTDTYKKLVDAGVKNIHAFDTINRIRQEKTAAKKRSLIRSSLLNGEQKAILYEDFLTDEDSVDAEILETFRGTEQIGAVVDCLSWMAEYDSSIPKRSSILNSGMSDWAKEYVYLEKLADDKEKEQARIDAFRSAKMKIDDYLKIKNKFSQIDKSVENDQKYAAMKQWMKEQGYSQEQWYVADEAIGFWITFRLNQKKAEKARW